MKLELEPFLFNSQRLRPKITGSDRLRLPNTAYGVRVLPLFCPRRCMWDKVCTVRVVVTFVLSQALYVGWLVNMK